MFVTSLYLNCWLLYRLVPTVTNVLSILAAALEGGKIVLLCGFVKLDLAPDARGARVGAGFCGSLARPSWYPVVGW